MGGGGKSYTPPAPPAPPVVDESGQEEAEAIERGREEARKAALRARGRQGTLLTGALGVQGETDVRRKTLLGW